MDQDYQKHERKSQNITLQITNIKMGRSIWMTIPNQKVKKQLKLIKGT